MLLPAGLIYPRLTNQHQLTAEVKWKKENMQHNLSATFVQPQVKQINLSLILRKQPHRDN